MNRRQFAKRGALTVTALAVPSLALKCGSSEKVSIYVQTISGFLNEIAGILPGQAAFIAKVIKVAADFDAAYQRGDFQNASTFFNTLVSNITVLINNLGVNVSSQVKIALAIVSSTVRLLAVLLSEQGKANMAAVISARASSGPMSEAIDTIERLANAAAVDAAYQAAKLTRP